ncbi:MAG: hypothetical protein ACO1OG_01390 [Devosia sp.]
MRHRISRIVVGLCNLYGGSVYRVPEAICHIDATDGMMPPADSEDREMTITLSTIARQLQPTAVLANVSKLLKRMDIQRPRRERRSMNG